MSDVDVLLLGATGVTGRVVAQHLARVAQVPWAVGGRSPDRLRQVVTELDGPAVPEVIEVDLDDHDAVDRAVAASRVVLSAAGPYARLSPPVIAACVRHGCAYVDLSGEMGFVAEMIRRHHDAARSSGARIVQVCGFEALPFDLGVRLLAQRALQETGRPLSAVEAVVSVDPGGPVGPGDLVSAGTVSSLREELASPRAARLTDPALLLPPDADAQRVRRATPSPLFPFVDRDGSPVAPMTPSPFLNPPVVLRTAALLGPAAGYDPDLAYREGTAVGGPAVALPLRAAAAGALSVAQVGVAVLAHSPAARTPSRDLRAGSPGTARRPRPRQGGPVVLAARSARAIRRVPAGGGDRRGAWASGLRQHRDGARRGGPAARGPRHRAAGRGRTPDSGRGVGGRGAGPGASLARGRQPLVMSSVRPRPRRRCRFRSFPRGRRTSTSPMTA